MFYMLYKHYICAAALLAAGGRLFYSFDGEGNHHLQPELRQPEPLGHTEGSPQVFPFIGHQIDSKVEYCRNPQIIRGGIPTGRYGSGNPPAVSRNIFRREQAG